MNNEKNKWWRYPVAVIVFWLLMLFGGSILLLWNALSPRMMRYEDGDLGYFILQILTGPVGVWLGHKALVALTGGKASQFSIINCVVAAVLLLGLATMNILTGGVEWQSILSVVATGIVAIVIAVVDNSEVKAANGQDS